MLAALEASLGVVTQACRKAEVSKSQFYKWLKEDPEFKEAVDDVEDIALDFVESQLYRQIQESNTTATIFYLKTKGRSRGYSERTEITGPEGQSFTPFQIILPKPQE